MQGRAYPFRARPPGTRLLGERRAAMPRICLFGVLRAKSKRDARQGEDREAGQGRESRERREDVEDREDLEAREELPC